MWSMGAGLADASCGELAQACQTIAAELAARPAPESGPAALEAAELVGGAADLVEAALATLVARVDSTGAYGEHGFPSVVSWLRERLGMRHGRAVERATVARQLPRLRRLRKLLTGSGLSFGFASAVCAATPRLDAADAAVAEDILLGMVEDGCSVGQVAKAGDRITDLIAERLGREVEPEDSKRGFARSWMTRSKSLDGGSWFKGWCNPEHTAALDQIIGPLAKPRAQGDDRDIAQRTADALFSVLTEGNRGAGITLIIDLAAYTAATGDTGPFTHTPRKGSFEAGAQPAGRSGPEPCGTEPCGTEPDAAADVEAAYRPGKAPRVAEREAEAEARASGAGPLASAGPSLSGRQRIPARLLDGTPISPEDARRIALNAGISALVLGREGIPIYLGRSTRFATSAQRRVLLARYDTCCVTGCRIPAHLCEIHHLDGGWKLGTPTDIDRLAPLCGWHNRWIEAHDDRTVQTRDRQGRTVLKVLSPRTTRQTTEPARRRSGDGPATATANRVHPEGFECQVVVSFPTVGMPDLVGGLESASSAWVLSWVFQISARYLIAR
ncbi:DUF222 domain-containing protein [Actinomadura scrupuli]|uniref:HNH endonuclease n=1 Tax=Actinomadura scrupuli TaxID=559629 RepID=UPI003D963385